MGEGADNLSAALTPRMRQLQQMLTRQPDDPFLLYGVAMEYKKAGDSGRALDYFGQVLQRDPNSYLYLDPAWKPAPPFAQVTGQFTFVDLLKYAGAA